MTAFLRTLIGILTAVTLLQHLLPEGRMGRVGRMVLGLALMYTVLSSLGRWTAPAEEAAAWLSQGQTYEQRTYEEMVRKVWEDGDGL